MSALKRHRDVLERLFPETFGSRLGRNDCHQNLSRTDDDSRPGRNDRDNTVEQKKAAPGQDAAESRCLGVGGNQPRWMRFRAGLASLSTDRFSVRSKQAFDSFNRSIDPLSVSVSSWQATSVARFRRP